MYIGWGNGGWGAGAFAVMAIGMVIFWSIIVFGVAFLVRYFGHSHDDSPRSRSAPGAILRERFARGEIDEDEFAKRMRALGEHK